MTHNYLKKMTIHTKFLLAILFGVLSLLVILKQQVLAQFLSNPERNIVNTQFNRVLPPQPSLPTQPEQTKQAPPDHSSLTIENYLKSKYYGKEIIYFDPLDKRFYRGQVVSHIKEKDQFYFLVYNLEYKDLLKVGLIYEKDYLGLLTRPRNPLNHRSNMSGKLFNVENEKQLTKMLQPMLGSGGSQGSMNTAALASLTQGSSKNGPGEKILYYDANVDRPIEGTIFIVKNHILLDDGSPVLIRFERVN